jgi:hypothetical protein
MKKRLIWILYICNRAGSSLILSSPSRARAYKFLPGLDRALPKSFQILSSPTVLFSKCIMESSIELLNVRLGRARASSLFTSSPSLGSDPALAWNSRARSEPELHISSPSQARAFDKCCPSLSSLKAESNKRSKSNTLCIYLNVYICICIQLYTYTYIQL